MTSKEEIETVRCEKESLDTGKIIGYQEQNVTKDNESISMIDTIHDLEQENKQLIEQLLEKDKEIEEYKTEIKEFCGTKLAKLIDKKEQEIRKQVCDEIRESCKKYLDVDLSNINDCHHRNLPAVILAEILDKIE